jgi:hypothetical protein
MSWRTSIIVLIELAFTLFPANIIGCVDPPDPYDDYIAFFRNDLAPARAYEPFYYVNEEVLYDPIGTDSSVDYFARDWARYCGVSEHQAAQFLYKSSSDDVEKLWEQMHSKTSMIPFSIKQSHMASSLLEHGDTAAVKYLRIAKQAEQYSAKGGNTWSDANGWYLKKQDSIAMSQLIEQSIHEYANTRNNFVRERYGFQAVRLAFYGRRPSDCIRFYEGMLKNTPVSAHLMTEALGYLGGSLFRLDRRREAAYAFSRSFSAHPNTSDYMSFNWCIHRFDAGDRDSCMAVCRSDREKGDMLGLFLLGSNVPEVASLRRMYDLGAGPAVQEVLAVREVNKIERNYFTPWLLDHKGGLTLNELGWTAGEESGDQLNWLYEAKELVGFYDSLSRSKKVSNAGLFETVSAQLCYVTRQFNRGDVLLDRAAALPGSRKIRDQQTMTRLLLAISEKSHIDSASEQSLLSVIRWLRHKARAERERVISTTDYGDDHIVIWRQLYRNLLSVVLAKRYHQQHEEYKEALCIGAAEQMNDPSGWQTKEYLEDQMTTRDLRILLDLVNGSNRTNWEAFLCNSFPVGADEIRSILSVSATRDHHFREALKWTKSIKDPKLLELGRNPFADVLSDLQDTLYPFDKGHFNKESFLSEMASLTDKERLGSATSKDLYRLAIGYYNMTYYGRAWELVKYGRSGSYWEERPEYKIPFDRDYYECYTAESYFRKAMNASADRNFKARCLFMMAKCAQKQIKAPSYGPGVAGWDLWSDKYQSDIRHNKFFPLFVKEYQNTAFYKEAYTTCSYLRDFVMKK